MAEQTNWVTGEDPLSDLAPTFAISALPGVRPVVPAAFAVHGAVPTPVRAGLPGTRTRRPHRAHRGKAPTKTGSITETPFNREKPLMGWRKKLSIWLAKGSCQKSPEMEAALRCQSDPTPL